MDLEVIRTDEKLENEGTWARIDNETEVLVASMQSRSYKKAAKKVTRPYRTLIDQAGMDSLPESTQDYLVLETLVEAVLLNWRGLKLDGKEIVYSKENARKVLTEFPRFRAMVEGASNDSGNFKAKALESEAKNSVAASAGSSPVATSQAS